MDVVKTKDRGGRMGAASLPFPSNFIPVSHSAHRSVRPDGIFLPQLPAYLYSHTHTHTLYNYNNTAKVADTTNTLTFVIFQGSGCWKTVDFNISFICQPFNCDSIFLLHESAWEMRDLKASMHSPLPQKVNLLTQRDNQSMTTHMMMLTTH